MGYTRRQELHCTEDELRENPSAVLYKGEILRVTSNDGKRVLREIMGDGKTPVGELTTVVDYEAMEKKDEEFAEELENVSVKVKGHDSQLEALDKRITNTWLAENLIYEIKKPSANLTDGPIFNNLWANAYPCVELYKIGTQHKKIMTRSANLLYGFEKKRSQNNYGWNSAGQLVVQCGRTRCIFALYGGKLPAGKYSFSVKVISEEISGFHTFGLYTETSGGIECVEDSKIAFDSGSTTKFTLTEETTVYLGMSTTGEEEIAEDISPRVYKFTLYGTDPKRFFIIDEYELPEAITSLDVSQDPYSFIDFEKGLLCYGGTKAGEFTDTMDVRNIIGYDDYILKALPSNPIGIATEGSKGLFGYKCLVKKEDGLIW